MSPGRDRPEDECGFKDEGEEGAWAVEETTGGPGEGDLSVSAGGRDKVSLHNHGPCRRVLKEVSPSN